MIVTVGISETTKPSLVRRLYRGDAHFDFIGTRKRWYLTSAVLLLICVVSFAVRGFNFGIDFKGGTSFQFPAAHVQLNEARKAVSNAGVEVDSSQFVGSGGTRSVLIKTPQISVPQEQNVKKSLSQIGVSDKSVSINTVSSSWGSDVTNKAITALVVFLALVCVFISIRFEWQMAVAAIVALLHDLLVSAGVYSLVGFEVTPSTVVGLLTILGFSLYDTVVVFDKISENTKGILGGTRTTYSEAANLAVNQTLMRSINTSLIALLPVAGLLFVGAGLLGVGTIKDLALVLFIGLASGAYSSLFLASPVLCDLKERDSRYVTLRRRVLAKRAQVAEKSVVAPTTNGHAPDQDESREPATVATTASAPRPGARPQGKRSISGKGGRSSAKKRR